MQVHKISHMQMFPAALFIMVKPEMIPSQSAGGWVNTTWYSHAIQHYPQIKRNETLTHAATQGTSKTLC